MTSRNKDKMEWSYAQLGSRKEAIAFNNRVTTRHKRSLTPTKTSKIHGRQMQSDVENFDEIPALNVSMRNW